MRRRWAVTAWCEGPEGAVRISVIVYERPDQNAYELRGEAAGLYRRRYQEWGQTRTSIAELKSDDPEDVEAGPISEEGT